ncbi:hypothetical protein [Candidatus Coxiella mudrowiae]|uniref:hypothetical protein n=1 Tax=Candidatus Coxiella mudrowiae TaxID=2054173 RepID=UPI0012FF05EF|nr:hypothetical protein [Candidatus Coxiella mudrowiae]
MTVMMSDVEELGGGGVAVPQVFSSAVFCMRYDYERGLGFAKEIWKAAPKKVESCTCGGE